MVVDYTRCRDQGRDEAAEGRAGPVAYTQDFGAFLSGANENLPKDVVAELVKSHVLTLKDIVDAQGAGDQAGRLLRPPRWRRATWRWSPTRWPTRPRRSSRTSSAGGAHAGGRPARRAQQPCASTSTWPPAPPAPPSAAARPSSRRRPRELDANSVDLSKAIGSAYGGDAEVAFLPLWRTHIGMVVDYTVGKATKDEMKQQKAVNDLVGYTQDFGAFLSGANENLPKDVVAELVKDHVLTLKDVIDAQAAGDQRRPFTAIRARRPTT